MSSCRDSLDSLKLLMDIKIIFFSSQIIGQNLPWINTNVPNNKLILYFLDLSVHNPIYNEKKQENFFFQLSSLNFLFFEQREKRGQNKDMNELFFMAQV